MRLTKEVLRLRLMQANLVATGNKENMVQRLLSQEAGAPARSGVQTSSPGESDSDELQGSARQPNRRRRVVAAWSSDGTDPEQDDVPPGVAEMDVEGESSPDPRRRPPTTVSTSDAASSDAEDGNEANPPQRHQHRGPKAHGSILHPRRSVRVLSPAGAVNRETASHTRRRFTDVAAPHALEPLHHPRASQPGSSSKPRPSRRGTPVSTSGRHQVDELRTSRTRTRKASPFFARGSPSRSRSRSRRHARRHRDSDDSSDSSSRSSTSSSSSSTSHHRRRRRRHRRSRRSSSFEEFSDAPFSSCVTAPAKYIVRKIRRGKFVELYKLLPPVLDEALTTQPGKRSGGSKRRIGDFASWMEAWCIFMAIRVHAFPESGLQLVKYQTIMCQLFSSYQAAVCIKYDSLFRQAIARDKSRLVPWDQVKEDILVWCATRQPFHPKTNTFTPGNTSAQRSSTTGGQPTQSSGHVTLSSTGKEICRRYNYGTCTRTSCAFAHKCWITGCEGDHPGKACTKAAAGAPG